MVDIGTRAISREAAATYALWFMALADGSRILLLNELALAKRPLTVGDLVHRLDIGQSTISHHLARLAKAHFVFLERHGNVTHVRLNEDCVSCFPSAAQAIMGLPIEEIAKK